MAYVLQGPISDRFIELRCGPGSAPLAAPGQLDPLLDETAPEVGIDQAAGHLL